MSVFDLPMTARPGKDAIAGQDELGRTVYRTVTGERYTMPERTEMPAPTMGQRFENLGGLASRAYENLSVQGAIDAAKGIGEGIVSGIVQGFTAPGRALSGEPVSFGDVLATAGMAQVGAAPMRAPAGSLRSGAMGGGRPPVTFDDVARAMDEGAPAPSPSFTLYQGSPHNFAAERLVRMPDGSTQYIVGAPDVLPDVPAGAEVLQDFPLGRQRSDKIGTGEGAQAYGYGLYGAEAEGVARGYRDALSKGDPSDPLSNLYDLVKSGLPVQEARAIFQEIVDEGASSWPEAKRAEQLDFARQTLEAIDSGAIDNYTPPGSMYEMQVNADPEAFIDWDKPLSEQPKSVQDAFSGLGTPDRMRSVRGEDAYRALEMESGAMDWPVGADAATRKQFRDTARINASEKLREAGIPGIKYLDAGSRYSPANLPDNPISNEARKFLERSSGDAKAALKAFSDSNPVDRWATDERAEIRKVIEAAGKPVSRNFVIFDENLISIVRKYGIAGAAAMLGVSAIDVEQALADNLPQDQWESLVVGK